MKKGKKLKSDSRATPPNPIANYLTSDTSSLTKRQTPILWDQTANENSDSTPIKPCSNNLIDNSIISPFKKNPQNYYEEENHNESHEDYNSEIDEKTKMTGYDPYHTSYNCKNRIPKSKRKVLDAVHSFITFDDFAWEYIDTPQFQRLRGLKQLGFCNYVYPGAVHTRFEHSLGVGHLAGIFMENAFKNSISEEINMSAQDRSYYKQSVMLAGLFHDLGHGPFSHSFDAMVIPTIKPGIKWSHEDASEMMLDYLIDDNNIDIEKDQIRLIKSLIKPSDEVLATAENKWIYEIVANYKTSIDVDRWDYMTRDPQMTGLTDLKFDSSMFFENYAILNNKVVFNKKMAPRLNDFFNHRYKLFKYLYLNASSVSFDFMYQDLMVLANEDWKFEEIIYQPEEYMKLNDGILFKLEDSKNKNITDLVKRFNNRDNYKFIGELNLPLNKKRKFSKNDIDKITKDIVGYQKLNGHSLSQQLRPEDLCVDTVNITYIPANHYKNIQLYDPHSKSFLFLIKNQMAICSVLKK